MFNNITGARDDVTGMVDIGNMFVNEYRSFNPSEDMHIAYKYLIERGYDNMNVGKATMFFSNEWHFHLLNYRRLHSYVNENVCDHLLESNRVVE